MTTQPPENLQTAAKDALQKQSNSNVGKELIANRTELESILTSMSGRIKQALPKHVTPERIIRLAINAYSRTPKLAECTKTSVLGVIVKASELGLELDTLGQAYMVPYKNKQTGRLEAQLIPGYPGLIELGLRSGKLSKWEAHNVYEKDQFDYEYGTNEHLRHVPFMGQDRGELTCAYSIVTFKDGNKEFFVMPRFDIEKVRARSQQAEGTLWRDNFDEACRKTVIRRHSKTLPKSPELAQAVKMDELAYAGRAQEIDIEKATEGGDIPIADFEEVETKQLTEGEKPAEEKTSKTKAKKEEPAVQQGGNEFNFLVTSIEKAKEKSSLVLVSKRMTESRNSGLLTPEQFNTLTSKLDERENALAAEKPTK